MKPPGQTQQGHSDSSSRGFTPAQTHVGFVLCVRVVGYGHGHCEVAFVVVVGGGWLFVCFIIHMYLHLNVECMINCSYFSGNK
jgi:hypothetical protein